MRPYAAVMLLALGAPQLGAQGAAPVALDGRVPPAVAVPVQALADSLARSGIPGQSLLRKALEGSAKGVPADRIVLAVRTVAGQLEQSAVSLHSAGAVSDSMTIEAGAYAINAGLKGDQVAEIARASHAPYQPAQSLQSAGTLVAMGVPPGQAAALVREWIAEGKSPRDISSLPAQVQAAMGPGLTASQAAKGMSKGGGHPGGAPNQPPGQGKGDNPPSKGNPPGNPRGGNPPIGGKPPDHTPSRGIPPPHPDNPGNPPRP